MEHVRSFQGFPALPELQAFLAAKTTPFATSELYSSANDAKIVDLEKRKSQFRLFKEPEAFDLVNQTVQWLNKSDKNYSYQLRRDDITETRYEKGGQFLKHKDYLSVTSNLVEEFTLILCVTPEHLAATVKGGETLIYPYASRRGVAFDTTTPGNGLLFRKDLEHAGDALEQGEKHILTANLWATRKQVSNQVLFVTFPATQEDDSDGGTETTLQQAADQDSSYALPVDTLCSLKGTVLDAHVRFVNQGFEDKDQDPPTVVTYHCSNFSFEEFGTVAKILQRSYVNEDEISRHAHCLDFFGPFAAENLLVNLAVETPPNNNNQATCERFVQPGNQDGDKKMPAKMTRSNKKSKTTGTTDAQEPEDLDVIVCENESRTEVVSQVARLLGLDTFVPFKIMFVQGKIESDEGGYKDIPMTPVALLVGDYNHAFALQKCERSVDVCSLKEYHTERNYWNEKDAEDDLFDDGEGNIDDDERDMYEAEHEFYSKGRGLGLKVALGEERVRNKLTRIVFENCLVEGWSVSLSSFRHLRCFSGSESDDDDDASDSESEAGPPSLFHRDDSGKATFTSKEADAASNFIASMGLEERVKACIQKKRFELPQQSKELDEYYCNDSVYGNLHILFVTGALRLDSSVASTGAASTKATKIFDAWPTKQQKKKAERKRSKHYERLGMNVPGHY